MNTRPLDEIAARIGQAFQNSPAKDIEKQMKQMLTNGLARLDVVPRSEFDVQAQVLLRTREKLEALERRLTELESRMGVATGTGLDDPSGSDRGGRAGEPEGPNYGGGAGGDSFSGGAGSSATGGPGGAGSGVGYGGGSMGNAGGPGGGGPGGSSSTGPTGGPPPGHDPNQPPR